MLDTIPNDCLYSICSLLQPEDISQLSTVSTRLRRFVVSNRRRLPRFSIDCAMKLVGPHAVSVKLRRRADGFDEKHTFRMPKMDSAVGENLAGYEIRNLSLFGAAAESPIAVSDCFVQWLGTHLAAQMDLVSLRNLDLSALADQTWGLLVERLAVDGKFSCEGCEIPRLSMLYQLYNRIGSLAALSERCSKVADVDISESDLFSKNREIAERIAEGETESADLSGIVDFNAECLRDFVSCWTTSKTPNPFSFVSFPKPPKLIQTLEEMEGFRNEHGMLVYDLHSHQMRLVVDYRPILSVNFAVRRIEN